MLTSVSFICLMSIPFIVLGFLKEYLYICFLCKMIRGAVGGVHVRSKLVCWSSSLLIIICSLLIGNLVFLPIWVECLVWLFLFVVWYKLVPQGSEQRPLRNMLENKRRKYVTLIYMVVCALVRFVSLKYYLMFISCFVFSYLLLLPITYRLACIKHDREDRG